MANERLEDATVEAAAARTALTGANEQLEEVYHQLSDKSAEADQLQQLLQEAQQLVRQLDTRCHRRAGELAEVSWHQRGCRGRWRNAVRSQTILPEVCKQQHKAWKLSTCTKHVCNGLEYCICPSMATAPHLASCRFCSVHTGPYPCRSMRSLSAGSRRWRLCSRR